ncbi:MAG: group III truncated hemoglobin [Alphaproteobacteria bacterium]|nr:group III truncated hemoglobin [Alphaproteobacteria bacterium]
MSSETDHPGRTPTPEEEAQARAIIEKGFEDAIDHFYAAVREDDLIGPVFHAAVHDWDGHKRTMVDFWSRVVLGTERYNGMPLPPHVKLDLNDDHFTRWLDVWSKACNANMPEPLAEHVIARSRNMASHWSAALKSVAQQHAKFAEEND